MSESRRLREENERLRAALEDIRQAGTYDGHSEFCDTEWESVHAARFEEVTEDRIEADLRKHCCCPAKQVYLAEKALKVLNNVASRKESAPLSDNERI